jgi:hypothetical protein
MQSTDRKIGDFCIDYCIGVYAAVYTANRSGPKSDLITDQVVL